jgi:DNA-binding XRE family transcriptional regulator
MCASNLKIYRLKAGLTQWELARRLGIKERVVTLFETNRAIPTVEVMVDISKILLCDPSDIWSDVFAKTTSNSKGEER